MNAQSSAKCGDDRQSFPRGKPVFWRNPGRTILAWMACAVIFVIRHDLDRLHFFVRTPCLFGPNDRLRVGREVKLDNAFFNTIHGTITVRDFAFFGQNCMVLTGGHNYRCFNEERQWAAPSGNQDIIIGRGVWVGSGAIILGGVEICDHAVIAAGAVVTKSCEQPGIYAGIPSRLIKAIEPPGDKYSSTQSP